MKSFRLTLFRNDIVLIVTGHLSEQDTNFIQPVKKCLLQLYSVNKSLTYSKFTGKTIQETQSLFLKNVSDSHRNNRNMIRAVYFHHLLTGLEKHALSARSSLTGPEEEDEKLNNSFQRRKTQQFKQSNQISQNETSKIPISLSESKFIFQDKPKKIDLDDFRSIDQSVSFIC